MTKLDGQTETKLKIYVDLTCGNVEFDGRDYPRKKKQSSYSCRVFSSINVGFF